MVEGGIMKKIILFIMILSSIVGLNIKVRALTYSDKFYISDVINNIYYGKTKNGTTEYRKAKFKRRLSDNKIVYCIEPFVDLNEEATLKGYDYNYEQLLNLSKSDWERISLLAYYGYGYNGHTADKWYPITQLLIWKTIDKNATFFWTDTFEGNKINKFEEETKELESLVNNHKKLPSYANHIYDVSIKEHIVLNDSNKVLDNYEISTDKEFDVVKDGDNLIFNTGDEEKSVTIYFTKKDKKYDTPPIVYVSNTYQNTLLVGSYEDVKTSIKLNIESGSIRIKKVDSDSNSITPSGDASLIGAVYELKKGDNVVGEITIGENNEGVLEHIPYGTYIIKEKQSGVGYKIDQNEYSIKINAVYQNLELELKNEVIKNKIKLYKYIGNDNKKVESNIIFMIYDSDNNLYSEVTTDENGIVEVELPYGIYTFKQKNTTDGYNKVEDFKVEVKEENDNVIEYYLYDLKVPDTEEDLKTMIMSVLLIISGIIIIVLSYVKD